MPFIIQCPYPECGKYMLLEDSDRGSTVKCLVCKKPIKLDPTNPGEMPAAAVSPGIASPTRPAAPAAPKPAAAPSPAPAAAPAAPAAAATAQRQIVRTCTKCNTPLKVPAGAEKQRIRCPRCQNVF
jgi:LSD1 subclass zinc finger protein